MKNFYFLLLLLLPGTLFCQLTTEDFEAFELGSFDPQWDATQWVGWFGNPSGTEISDEQAASGTKSLLVSENDTQNDIVALLGELDYGIYTVSFNQFIPSGFGAYFNLQHNYTNSAGDWAAEVYFSDETFSVGQIITDGVQTPFDIIHDQWVPIRFELNFFTEIAEMYYNENLVLTWVLPTNASGGPGLNQINGINFFAACIDDGSNTCVSRAYYDDISVVAGELPAHDAALRAVTYPYPYTHIPISQVQAFDFEAVQLSNFGMNEYTNAEVKVDIYREGALLQSQPLATLASLASGETSTLSTDFSYTPPALGNYRLDYVVTISEEDLVSENDTVSLLYVVTDDMYARDNGNYTNGIGVDGASALLGQVYDIYQTIEAKAIRFSYAGGAIGETVQGTLVRVENGIPVDLLGETNIYTLEEIGTIGAEIMVELPFAETAILSPGQYGFIIEQQGVNNLTLSTAPAIFQTNSTMVSTDGGNNWAPLESFGFRVALSIRPVMGDAIVSTQTPDFATQIQLAPSPASDISILQMQLDQPQDLHIQLFDTNGKQWSSQKINQAIGQVQYTIDVQDVPSGTYFVRISNDQGVVSRKLSVVH